MRVCRRRTTAQVHLEAAAAPSDNATMFGENVYGVFGSETSLDQCLRR
jgi:hypothetical protein